MSYTHDREEFLIRLDKAGVPVKVGRRVLALSQTLQRLAVAACNGDYPADNGQRRTDTCSECGGNWAPESMVRGVCPQCRAKAALTALLQPFPVTARTGGDPRGAVVTLRMPDGYTDDWGTEGFCVPVRVR